MVKVINPHKEYWNKKEKSNCMVLIKDKKDNSKGIVRSVGLKRKKSK